MPELATAGTKSGAGEGLGCTVTCPEPSRLSTLPLVHGKLPAQPPWPRAGWAWGFGLPPRARGRELDALILHVGGLAAVPAPGPLLPPRQGSCFPLERCGECALGWDTQRIKPSAHPGCTSSAWQQGEPRACPPVVTFSLAGADNSAGAVPDPHVPTSPLRSLRRMEHIVCSQSWLNSMIKGCCQCRRSGD